MKSKKSVNPLSAEELIAPCGMNCGICLAYLRDKNKCSGCRCFYEDKPVTRAKCKIKNCENLPDIKMKFCFMCTSFPCKRLKNIDKRYRTKYHMSMIENLNMIQKKGIRNFLEKEKDRWKCQNCGGVICCHNGLCYNCQQDIIKNRKKLLGWEID